MKNEEAAAKAMKEAEDSGEEGEIRELKAGLQAMQDQSALDSLMKESAEEKEKKEEALKNPIVREILGNLAQFVHKDTFEKALKEQKERQDKFEALILKAKARGKATISEEKKDAEEDIKKLVKGTVLEDEF